MDTQIINVINSLASKVGMTVDWSAKNIMPYIKDLTARYAQYEAQKSMFYIIFGIILVVCGAILVVVARNYREKEPDIVVLCVLFSLILGLLGIFAIFYNLDTLLTARNIPEKLLYDLLTASH